MQVVDEGLETGLLLVIAHGGCLEGLESHHSEDIEGVEDCLVLHSVELGGEHLEFIIQF